MGATISQPSFTGGLLGQTGRNLILQPLWGNNTKLDGSGRTGQQTADVATGLLGGAVAAVGVRNLVALSQAPIAGPGMLKIGWGAAVGLGVAELIASGRNLFSAQDAPAPPPPDPTPDPNPDPTPPKDPGQEPPSGPPDVPGPPDTDPPPTEPGRPPGPPPEVPFPPGEHPPHVPFPPGGNPGQTPPTKPPHGPVQTPPTKPPHTNPPPSHPAPQPTVYRVHRNDTLSTIADCFDVSWRQLYWRNRDQIANPDIIYQGQKLIVPGHNAPDGHFRYTPTYPQNASWHPHHPCGSAGVS
jgi:nucleoid-associated protein YgaU